MKRKMATVAAVLVGVAVLFTACAGEAVVSENIQLPADTLATQPDDSIPILTGDRTKELRGNIDRGFRLETYYTLGSGEAWPGDGIDGYAYLNDMLAFYSAENVREIQVYIYLKEYYNRDLDQHALDQMKTYFEYIRSKGMSMVLRFAYESDQNSEYAPKQKQLLRHVEQLGAWIDQNIGLWNDTVTVFQIGMIGAWGEFGSSNVNYNRGKIINAVCGMVPENTYIQGRYMVVTQEADEEYAERVGYHNDFLVGRPHPWNTAGGDNASEEYARFAQTNKFRLNDGEMPWAGGTQEPEEYVDGKKLIQQLYEHHMTTFPSSTTTANSSRAAHSRNPTTISGATKGRRSPLRMSNLLVFRTTMPILRMRTGIPSSTAFMIILPTSSAIIWYSPTFLWRVPVIQPLA